MKRCCLETLSAFAGQRGGQEQKIKWSQQVSCATRNHKLHAATFG